MTEISIRHEAWRPCYRIVPSRFPPVGLFDRVANPTDLEAVLWVESLTNDRLRDEVGELHLVAAEDRASGPGTTPIMAAFTHLNPLGSRFSDGSFGVYYASRGLETAVKETVYHHEQFLRYSHEKAMELPMRVYLADLAGEFHDLRGLGEHHPEWYHSSNYAVSQQLGTELRQAKSWGILYDSVRHAGGGNVAVLRPPVLSACRQGRHLGYVWNGRQIEAVIERREMGITL